MLHLLSPLDPARFHCPPVVFVVVVDGVVDGVVVVDSVVVGVGGAVVDCVNVDIGVVVVNITIIAGVVVDSVVCDGVLVVAWIVVVVAVQGKLISNILGGNTDCSIAVSLFPDR